MTLTSAENRLTQKNQEKIKARLIAFKKLCKQARRGDIYLLLEESYVASIICVISKSERQCEKFCLIHYKSTANSHGINTAESQARMEKRIIDGEYVGGLSFASVLDAYIAKQTIISSNPPFKEQPG